MNTTEQNSTIVSDMCEKEIWAAGLITLIEGIITFILNGTVIVLLVRRRKKTNIVLLILHLAVTDLAVATFHDFTRTIQLLTDWTYGEHTCRAFLYSQQVALFASTYILLSMCYDRLIALWKPLWPGRTNKRNRYAMIIFPWIFAVLFSLPYLKSGIIVYSGKVWCTPFFSGKYGDIYLPIQMTLMTFIPAVILIIVYSFIVNIIRTGIKGPKIFDNRTSTKSEDTKVNHNQFHSLRKAERRSILVAVVVGLAFIICWVPYSFSIVFNRFIFRKSRSCASFYIPNAFAPLNSAVNPVLIVTFNHKMFKRYTLERDTTGRTLLSSRKSLSNSDKKK